MPDLQHDRSGRLACSPLWYKIHPLFHKTRLLLHLDQMCSHTTCSLPCLKLLSHRIWAWWNLFKFHCPATVSRYFRDFCLILLWLSAIFCIARGQPSPKKGLTPLHFISHFLRYLLSGDSTIFGHSRFSLHITGAAHRTAFSITFNT